MEIDSTSITLYTFPLPTLNFAWCAVSTTAISEPKQDGVAAPSAISFPTPCV